mmetsp:Transcript_33748/g.103944  ORF Transcript_33748/g.103944 Transcript_33748/m.103944 type:complete len:300 (+) Transcript_33748:32-931(+)
MAREARLEKSQACESGSRRPRWKRTGLVPRASASLLSSVTSAEACSTASTACTAGKVRSRCREPQKMRLGSSTSNRTRRRGQAASLWRSCRRPTSYSAAISRLLPPGKATHRTSSKRSCRSCTNLPSSAISADLPMPASPCSSTKRRSWPPPRSRTSSRWMSTSRPTKSSTRAGTMPQASPSGAGATSARAAPWAGRTSSWSLSSGSRANLRPSSRTRLLGWLASAATPQSKACRTLLPEPRAMKKWRSKTWQLVSSTEASLRMQTTWRQPAAARCCPRVKEWQELMSTRPTRRARSFG